jgi:hypothetical protein
MENNFIYCEIAENSFGLTKKATSYEGDVSVRYLLSKETPYIETQPREYQREKVAPLSWKQLVMLTVLLNGYKKIPQIHIRVVKADKVWKFELIDGQQRITSILDFVNGKFCLPNSTDYLLNNGIDLRGMNIENIREMYPHIYEQILSYRISCVWYENLTNEQTADLFINVLNNTNNMNPQEIRNAVRGPLSEYIRNTARFNLIDLFERTISTKTEKQVLKHFSEKFTLKGRMEVDEWLSELIYLSQYGFRNGVTQKGLTDWIKFTQQSGGSISTQLQFDEFNETILIPLIKFSTEVITSVPNKYKYKLTSMLSLALILYGYELKTKYGKLNVAEYISKFFEVYSDWSDTNKKLYLNHTMWSSNSKQDQMQPFNKLFNGKNKTAFQTIAKVLDIELNKNIQFFGVIRIDIRDFSKHQIIQKWEEQGRKCFYTDVDLELKDICGDHYIPKSYGIDMGGVTEYHNLVVTSKKLNARKLNIHGDDFIKLIREERNTI